MASSLPADSPAATLSFTSWNDDKPTTIILLHGGFSCGLEYALVLPHLSDFHVLLPDLPLHSTSRHIKPGTTENSARHVAQLIQSHAHGGKAHVVGVSMGGFIGQCLALDQPDLVLSLFVSGAAPVAGARALMSKWPRFTYYSMRIMLDWLPEWVFRYQGLNVSSELIAELRANVTWELMLDMFPWITAFSLDQVRQLKVRTLSIAGAKGDDVPMIEKTADALRSRRTIQDEAWPDDGSGAVVLREAVHAWDLQLPELFAQGVSAWVKGESLPSEFERL
ncbi:alpha/beta-hydrolase [Aaosphaeria arxii CBS 175.79]|uniref:Alpha/beta-hydrolase n=1 Tax=Aaosphaeria arxii CBS 175.79 TaxID=1450172 RepID=A0A6A5XU54_9PLEO|nr:alpha/beta-hydrolase [Aaosphaeria arxii CBS 175.79]KAF2016241.1 alpha/beta-hydrolase [Aaosphaeria arxii CBS 175.79]